MKASNIMGFIIFISVTILYIVTSIILYFAFKNNLTLTLFLESMVLVNLSMWIECNLFVKKFKKTVLEIQEERNN